MLTWSPRIWLRFAVLLTFCGLCGCNKTSSAPEQTQTGAQTLLRGSFSAVTRPASGTASIVLEDKQYTLLLQQTNVSASGAVHVYLVGLPEATTSHQVDAAELKFDMGELANGQTEQRIALPSAPDPALRSVVLWDPKYAANLGSAALTPP